MVCACLWRKESNSRREHGRAACLAQGRNPRPPAYHGPRRGSPAPGRKSARSGQSRQPDDLRWSGHCQLPSVFAQTSRRSSWRPPSLGGRAPENNRERHRVRCPKATETDGRPSGCNPPAHDQIRINIEHHVLGAILPQCFRGRWFDEHGCCCRTRGRTPRRLPRIRGYSANDRASGPHIP
jgi:hypothetical protein